jgi:hypothetical protein
MLAAPVRFSTTNPCPMLSWNFLASSRACGSVPPPGATGTMIRTGFKG